MRVYVTKLRVVLHWRSPACNSQLRCVLVMTCLTLPRPVLLTGTPKVTD